MTSTDAPIYTVTEAIPDYLRFLGVGGRRSTQIGVPRGRLPHRLWRLLRLLPLLMRAELVVCEEYLNIAMVALLMRCTGSRGRVVALGLNVSGNKMVRTSWRPLDRFINWLVFRRLDLVVVASQPEADIFHALHDIDRDRFAFVHWAYDLPTLPSTIRRPGRPYFCLIGRNNRDHETFCSALEKLDADGVIVSGVASTLVLPPNVQAYSDLPFGDCIDLIRHSVASCVLVRDANRGAGHITIVTAMHCARPQIVSEVDTATDYFLAGRHALIVPLHDPAAVRNAMKTLLDDPDKADAMGVAAARYAARWLTHERRRSSLERRFRQWFETSEIAWADSEWLAKRADTVSGSL